MIRNKVAQFFDSHGITIATAHHLTGVSRSSLTRMYRNEVVNVNFDTLDAICNAYNCNIQDLFEFIPNDKMTTEDKQEVANRKLNVEYYTKIRRKNHKKSEGS